MCARTDSSEIAVVKNARTGTFNVLAYTNIESEVPTAWADSDAHLIQPGTGGGVEHVKLRSFTTSIHKVEGLVAYRLGEDA